MDDTLTSHPFIDKLIGNNPRQVMVDNHSHHASFMATVFCIGNYELLARTVPWVYRAYSTHKFSFDYFSLALKTWMDAIEKHISADLIASKEELTGKRISSFLLPESHDLFPFTDAAKKLTQKTLS